MFYSHSLGKRKSELVTWAKSNKIEAIPDIETIEQIRKLELSNKGLEKLPKQIDCLTNLEILDISINHIAELPNEIRKLKNLKTLNLSYNKFQKLPTVVCQLENLQSLNLESNDLKKINKSIRNLKNLKELNLFANKIEKLPSELCQLTNLTWLNVALNKLSKLPSNFSNLSNITYLEIWLNKSKSITETIPQLPNLKELNSTIAPDKLNSIFIWAVKCNNILLADKLIVNGADVNYRYQITGNYFFTTPLFEATSFEMLTLLIAMGADPNLEREIVKHVVTKNGEELRPTGKFESFLTKKHPLEIKKFVHAYIATNKIIKQYN
jgi:hypothetical protein